MYLLGGSLFIYKDLGVIKGDENGIIDNSTISNLQ